MVAFERRAAHSKALEEASLTISASDSEQDVWVHGAARDRTERTRGELHWNAESSNGTHRGTREEAWELVRG